MRLVMLVLLMVFSSMVTAQMPAGMQEAINCMQSLDQEALKDLGTQGEKLSKEIKALCKEGDESGARDLAMEYIKDLEGNENLVHLKKCSEMMQKVMPGMPMPEMPTAEMYEEESDTICDDID